MDKLTPQDVYMITEPAENFQRTDEFVLTGGSGNVIHYLERRERIIAVSKMQMYDILEEAFEAGRIHGLTGEEPGKEEYIDSLLDED